MAVVLQVVGEYDGKDLAKAQRDLNKLKGEVEGSTSTYAAAGGGLAGLTATAAVAGESMRKAGRTATVGLTLPLAAVGVAGVKTAADFDATMASFQVNSGVGAAAMEGMRALAVKMGADTVYSAGEAAAAMLELSKGGMSAANIQGGALASTMSLAATEGIALDRAATIVSQSMATFGLKAEDSARVADLLAAGAVASTASVEDLAGGMEYVGSSAAALHMPMADTVTALAALNNAGIDSTTAGSSLNRMLLGIAAPTRQAAKAFADYGVSLTDSKGQMLPMGDVIGQLQDKLGGLGDAEKAAALKRMFGVEGMRAANVLMADGTKGWSKLSSEVTKGGVAQQMADARMSGMAGTLERAKGSAQTAALAVGEALRPAVETVAGWVETLTNKFTALSPGMRTAIVTVGALVAAAGPVLLIVGHLLTALGPLISAFRGVAIAIRVVTMAMAANPWLLLIAAVVALVVIIVRNWDTIKAYLLAAWEWIKATAGAVWGAISGVITAVWNGIKAAAQAVWGAIRAYFETVFAVYRAIFTTAWNAIKAVVAGAWNAIKSTVETIARAVKTVIETYIRAWLAVFDKLREWVTKVANALTSARDAAVSWLGRIRDLVAQKVTEVVSAFWSKIKAVKDKVVDAFEAARSAAGEWIGKIASRVGDKVGDITAKFAAIVADVRGVGADIVRGLWNGIKGGWSWLLDQVKNLVGGLVGAAKRALGISSPSKVFAGIGEQVGAGLVDGMQGMRADVSTAVSALVLPTTIGGLATEPPFGLNGPTSSSRTVLVQRGAVQVTVNAGGGAADTAVGRVVADAVQDALTQLLAQVRAV